VGDHREISNGGTAGAACINAWSRSLVPVRTLISRLPLRKLETIVPLVCFAVYNRRLLQVAHTCARESEIASCNRGCDSGQAICVYSVSDLFFFFLNTPIGTFGKTLLALFMSLYLFHLINNEDRMTMRSLESSVNSVSPNTLIFFYRYSRRRRKQSIFNHCKLKSKAQI